MVPLILYTFLIGKLSLPKGPVWIIHALFKLSTQLSRELHVSRFC